MIGRRGRVTALVVGAALTATLVTATPASASWTDPDHAGGTVAAGRVLPPTNFSCRTEGLLTKDLVFSWQSPASGGLPRERYRIELRSAGNLIAAWDVGASATTYRVNAGLLAIGSAAATITSYSGTWHSDPAAPGSRTVNVVTSLLVSC